MTANGRPIDDTRNRTHCHECAQPYAPDDQDILLVTLPEAGYPRVLWCGPCAAYHGLTARTAGSNMVQEGR